MARLSASVGLGLGLGLGPGLGLGLRIVLGIGLGPGQRSHGLDITRVLTLDKTGQVPLDHIAPWLAWSLVRGGVRERVRLGLE